jgi:argininosuccinate synthase
MNMSINFAELIHKVAANANVREALTEVIDSMLDKIEGNISIRSSAQAAIDEARTVRDVLVEAAMANPNEKDDAEEANPDQLKAEGSVDPQKVKTGAAATKI